MLYRVPLNPAQHRGAITDPWETSDLTVYRRRKRARTRLPEKLLSATPTRGENATQGERASKTCAGRSGGSLAVVSGCPNRANGHTGVKGKAAQAALLQQCWEDICSRFKRYLLWNFYLMGHFSYLCEQLWPEVWEQIWACLFYETTLMIKTSQSP